MRFTINLLLEKNTWRQSQKRFPFTIHLIFLLHTPVHSHFVVFDVGQRTFHSYFIPIQSFPQLIIIQRI